MTTDELQQAQGIAERLATALEQAESVAERRLRLYEGAVKRIERLEEINEESQKTILWRLDVTNKMQEQITLLSSEAKDIFEAGFKAGVRHEARHVGAHFTDLESAYKKWSMTARKGSETDETT